MYDESIEQIIVLAEDAMYNGEDRYAGKLLESGLLEEPGYPKLHYTMGWMYHYHRDHVALAERHYLLALHFDAGYSDAYEGLAQLYLKHRKFALLHRIMTKAARQENINKEFVFQVLGQAAEARGQFAKAISYYKKALMYCFDNGGTKDLRQNIKRSRLKRIKTIWKKWPLQQ